MLDLNISQKYQEYLGNLVFVSSQVGHKDAERKLAKVWQVGTLANFEFTFPRAGKSVGAEKCSNATFLPKGTFVKIIYIW